MSRPARIVFGTAGTALPGGIASVARSTLKSLARRREIGELSDLRVIALHGDPPTEGAVDYTYSAKSSKARFSWAFLREVSRTKPDLAVFDCAGVSRIAGLLGDHGPPFIAMVHGREMDPPIRTALLRPLRRAACILAPSSTTGDKVRDALGVGARVIINEPCIEQERLDLWEAGTGEARRGPPSIVSIGRMRSDEPGKGFDTLVQALPQVLERADARLLLVGEGDGQAALRSQAALSAASDRVEFPGRVSDRELGHLLAAGSVFALPSRQEGFGIVFAEAMWHSLPCVGTTTDAAVDVIDHGSTGLLVPYDNPSALAAAIGDLLEDANLRERLGRAGRAKCLAKYTFGAFDQRLWAAIRQCEESST